MADSDLVADVRGVSKSYGPVHALIDVDFQLAAGEVRALLGKNGAGKSTLIRLLSGAENPDSGAVHLGGRPLHDGGIVASRALGVRTVYQELSLVDTLSVTENMFMGQWIRNAGALDLRRMTHRTAEALAALELDIDPGMAVEQLSAADQQMVEIARAIRERPRLLILDEPTSSLAAAEVDRVLRTVTRIADSGVAVIYVSHRLGEIRQIADAASVMRDGRLIDTRELAHIDTREVVRMMIGDTAEEIPVVDQAGGVDGEVLVQLDGVVAEPGLVGVDLTLRRGEVLGLAGVLGSGRTEILQIIAGIRPVTAGTIQIRGQNATGDGLAQALARGVGITPESRKELGVFPQLGVDEYMMGSKWSSVSRARVILPALVAARARARVERLDIKVHTRSTGIETLSGGNQQKAVIGRWLHADSEILLLDEPTRGVDVEAKAQIYALVRDLARQGRAVMFVSSEIEELPSVCDRVLVLRGGGIVGEYSAPDIDVDVLLADAIADHENLT
ncbi:MAG: sugar ABC transporter ATP-binding protein [Propioniciclava sp.]